LKVIVRGRGVALPAALREQVEAVAFLRQELEAWGATSIRTRIQKNLNLLSLEGTVAPALDTSEYLGSAPPALDSLKGKPVILFFWAHWCGDCKAQVPVLASLLQRYGDLGLTLVGPTQRYGYVGGGKTATAVEYLRVLAFARLYLDNFQNVQASWVTQGGAMAQVALRFGANDFGSTMLEENVVAATGIKNRLRVDEVVSLIREARFTPAQRDTKYSILKTF